MRHRALDYEPGTAVRDLGLAALDDVLDRGDLDDWAPVLREVRREPRGAVAARIEHLLEGRPAGATTALWRAFLDEARGATAAPGAPLGLRGLRRSRSLTQAEVARRLGATQPEVSKFERRADVRISTLRAYVQALGGSLRLTAAFEDREVELGEPPSQSRR